MLAVIYVKIFYIPFSFMKECNPPLVVQLPPIFLVGPLFRLDKNSFAFI